MVKTQDYVEYELLLNRSYTTNWKIGSKTVNQKRRLGKATCCKAGVGGFQGQIFYFQSFGKASNDLLNFYYKSWYATSFNFIFILAVHFTFKKLSTQIVLVVCNKKGVKGCVKMKATMNNLTWIEDLLCNQYHLQKQNI